MGPEDSFLSLFIHKVGGDGRKLGFLSHIEKEFEAHHQILLAHIDRLIPDLVIRLDEEVNAEEGVFYFGFGPGKFSKEKVSCVEKKDLCAFLFHFRDQCRFLGDPAKRASKSAAGLDLAHHIIGIDNTEMGFGCSMTDGCPVENQKEDEDEKDGVKGIFHRNLFSPARISMSSQFSFGAKGQVYFSLNSQKG